MISTHLHHVTQSNQKTLAFKLNFITTFAPDNLNWKILLHKLGENGEKFIYCENGEKLLTLTESLVVVYYILDTILLLSLFSPLSTNNFNISISCDSLPLKQAIIFLMLHFFFCSTAVLNVENKMRFQEYNELFFAI